MLNEEQCPPHGRYLSAEIYVSPQLISRWKQDCAKRMAGKNKTPAYDTYLQWAYGPHEAALFTFYAYADLPVPKSFDCIFHISHPEIYVRIPYILTQSIWEGWMPVDFVEHGHKHLCIFSFPQGVPDIIRQLPPEESYRSDADAGIRLGLCEFRDLQAIINRKTQVALLKLRHGDKWHEFDED